MNEKKIVKALNPFMPLIAIFMVIMFLSVPFLSSVAAILVVSLILADNFEEHPFMSIFGSLLILASTIFLQILFVKILLT